MVLTATKRTHGAELGLSNSLKRALKPGEVMEALFEGAFMGRTRLLWGNVRQVIFNNHFNDNSYLAHPVGGV